MATCGRPKKSDGQPCQNPVRRRGMACRFHGGPGALRRASRRPARSRASSTPWTSPAASHSSWRTAPASASSWQPPPEPPPLRPIRRPHLNARERERVREAADFCADVMADGSWEQEVADRLADRAGDAWQRLTRSRRRHNCKKLAQMARTVLKAKDQVHQLAAELAGQAASVVGVRGAALDFTKELVKRIPIVPIDAKLTAAARAIQLAGITLCLMNERPLTRCDCFIDLALTETKERVSQILETRLANWAELARFGPAPVSARLGGAFSYLPGATEQAQDASELACSTPLMSSIIESGCGAVNVFGPTLTCVAWTYMSPALSPALVRSSPATVTDAVQLIEPLPSSR